MWRQTPANRPKYTIHRCSAVLTGVLASDFEPVHLTLTWLVGGGGLMPPTASRCSIDPLYTTTSRLQLCRHSIGRSTLAARASCSQSGSHSQLISRLCRYAQHPSAHTDAHPSLPAIWSRSVSGRPGRVRVSSAGSVVAGEQTSCATHSASVRLVSGSSSAVSATAYERTRRPESDHLAGPDIAQKYLPYQLST